MLSFLRQLNRERISLSSSSFWLLFSSAFFLSIIQNSEIFSLFGIKINLILSFIVALAFSEIFNKDYLLISISIVIFSKFTPGMDRESISVLVMIFLFFLTSKSFSINAITIYLLTFISSFIFYIILDYQFIINNLFIVSIEAFLNSFSAILMYSLINRIKSF
ncbi:MAG: hypothetical protein EXS49_02240 [Candidatus Pacebacteria bacterium]|nr:hypothetical protein [Candidatus Paceibacterota bacterium]